MTILLPGTFRVSDHRKPIPDWVKVQSVLNAIAAGALPVADGGHITNARVIRYDHRPPLSARPFNTESNDFIPPQNDPRFIEPVFCDEHDRRTFGRKPGATRTVTTAGSDAGNARHCRDLQDTEAVHRAKLASRAGDYERATAILSSVRRKKKLKPKAKIPNRPFPRGHRPMQSRG